MKKYSTDHPNYIHYLRARILDKCMANDNGCLEYRGGTLKHKYGLTSITRLGIRKTVPVHRAIWITTHNLLDLSRSIAVSHSCKNPCCCNINHLKIRMLKDRTKYLPVNARRKLTRRSRLSNEEVMKIRASIGRLKDISLRYGISVSHVSQIRNGKRKQFVTDWQVAEGWDLV